MIDSPKKIRLLKKKKKKLILSDRGVTVHVSVPKIVGMGLFWFICVPNENCMSGTSLCVERVLKLGTVLFMSIYFDVANTSEK